ncbi:MAG: pantoate--beta-alanine ligase [Bacteroidetes bacterium]|jgi:pantoate--beta-alanine ligase|nr:pantoate--beta-alanine ligase [Bacteroidota bacterium]
MQFFKSRQAVHDFVQSHKKKDKTVGFVPTMGALHEGHIQLIKKSKLQNHITVVSIFVNPTQFNNQADYHKYPNHIKNDTEKLEQVGCDVLFHPDVEEMYPVPDHRKFDFGELEQMMEGAYRPGHFNGVAQIVSKLIEAVPAQKAYFGQKDFQQLAIVRKLVGDYNYPVEIIGCPTVRESDGLAMSSRNERLTSAQRQNAPVIYQSLLQAKKMYPEKNINEIKKYVVENINKIPEFNVEYFEIVDHYTLRPIHSPQSDKYVTACIAVYVQDVRLIDNINFF